MNRTAARAIAKKLARPPFPVMLLALYLIKACYLLKEAFIHTLVRLLPLRMRRAYLRRMYQNADITTRQRWRWEVNADLGPDTADFMKREWGE